MERTLQLKSMDRKIKQLVRGLFYGAGAGFVFGLVAVLTTQF